MTHGENNLESVWGDDPKSDWRLEAIGLLYKAIETDSGFRTEGMPILCDDNRS